MGRAAPSPERQRHPSRRPDMPRLPRAAWAVLTLAILCSLPTFSAALEPNLLPTNTEIIFTINIKQVRESEVVGSSLGSSAAAKVGNEHRIARVRTAHAARGRRGISGLL